MYGARRISMSLEEYHLLPRRLGWDYDYEGGRAIVAPADILIDVSRPVAAPVDVGSIGRLRLCLVLKKQVFALENLYFDAFRPTVETVGLRDGAVRVDGTMAMILYASGAMGAPMSCSRVLVDGNEPVAALLVVDGSSGPAVHVLMVHPRFQRRGLATALFGEVCAALARDGYEEICSQYLLANEPSRQWYRKLGFRERPDSEAIEHHRRFYHYERSRLQATAPGERRRIELRGVERELARWERMTAYT